MNADQPNLVFDLWRAANALEYIAAQCMELSKIALDRGTHGRENEGPVPLAAPAANPPVNVSRQDKENEIIKLLNKKKLSLDSWKIVNSAMTIYQTGTYLVALERMPEELLNECYEKREGGR